jgi:hypothetical protein
MRALLETLQALDATVKRDGFPENDMMEAAAGSLDVVVTAYQTTPDTGRK